MFIPRRLLTCTILSLMFSTAALAQTGDARVERATTNTPTITVSASATRVRFTALGPVRQTRLEVFDAAGNQLFDTGFLAGNIRDWSPQTAKGPALADGPYQCVITARDLAGRLSLKQGTVLVRGGEFSLQLGEASGAGATEASPPDGALALVSPEAPALTVAAHDGSVGSVTSTAGALTLRTGDIFSGKETERVRITDDGKVGIGTDAPEATLDVAGEVRARGGIRFDDGTTLNTAGGKLVTANDDGMTQVPVDGSGTTNQVTKWTNGAAGTLGDSAITETGGRVGIGVTSPTYKLVVGQDIGPGLTAADLTVSKGAGQSVSAYVGPSGARGMEFGWDESGGRAYVNAPAGTPIAFMQGGGERMRVDTAGNFGVGVTAPTARLDVAGNINTSTQYNLIGQRILSVPGPVGIQNLFVGLSAGVSPLIGHNNVAVGNDAGARLSSGHSNTFVGDEAGGFTDAGESNVFVGQAAGRNNTGGFNNIYLGREAGLNMTTGFRNTFLGRSAGTTQNSGADNTYVGYGTGLGLMLSPINRNTLLGAFSTSAPGVDNATAVGYQAQVTQNNSLVLGAISGVNGASADTNVGIGTSAPNARLHVAKGDAAITTQGNGLVLRATDGPKCYRVTVNNVGAISAAEVPCP